MAPKRAFVFLFVLVSLATSLACGKSKATPNSPGDNNNISRPISPPTPGGIIAGAAMGRAPALVAFLVAPLGGVATYGFFVVAIAGVVAGFMEVLGRDERNGKGPKP